MIPGSPWIWYPYREAGVGWMLWEMEELASFWKDSPCALLPPVLCLALLSLEGSYHLGQTSSVFGCFVLSP